MAACFDLDDTLYPESQFVLGGLAAAARALEDETGPLDALQCFFDVHDHEGPWRVFDSALAKLGIETKPDRMLRLVSAYRNHAPALTLFDKIPELLIYLREQAVITAIVTDGRPAIQKNKVAVLGVDKLVDHVVYTWDIQNAIHPKPDPAAFLHVEGMIGRDDTRFLYVGDNPSKDFPAPDTLGWTTLRLRHPGGYHRDDKDIASTRQTADSVDIMIEMIEGFVWTNGNKSC